MKTDPRLLQRLYTERFEGAEEGRRKLWQVLVEGFFQAFVRPDDCVVDVAAGEGLFLSPLKARKRIAIDLRPPPRGIDPDIEWRSESWQTGLRPTEADVIFISNFLEHLGSKEEVLECLRFSERSLRAAGRLLILQPNIRFVGGAYWDFFDHKIPLTEKSLVEGLSLANLRVTHLISRFRCGCLQADRGPRLMKLSVVVPAHDEEESIERTVTGIARALNSEQIPHEILVVVDHCNDGTAEVVARMAHEVSGLVAVVNRDEAGYGMAVRAGLSAFTGDCVAIMMADASDDPK